MNRKLLFAPPLGAAAGFILCYLVLRFSPYGALGDFLHRPRSVRFYDRWENLVQIVPLENGLRREYAPPETIPPALAEVFVCAEDARFYGHPGIDPAAVLRAAYQNLRSRRRVSGASTITMQLARIIAEGDGTNRRSDRGSNRRGFFVKAAEAVNALRLEARFSKKTILSLYLNAIPFGFQTEGIASAGRNFFSAGVSALSPAESFCLAVIPRRPAAYNPLTEKAACARAAAALAARFASDPRRKRAFPSYASLSAEDWEALRPRRFRYPRHMPHLVRHVETPRAGEDPRRGGAVPKTGDHILSADLELQRLAEDLLSAQLERYAASRLSNGAAIVIDNRTGEVLAWAGNRALEESQIDGVLVKNQMGSSMKPFLYALALERGWGPSELLADIPSRYGGEEVYIPRNFNNRFNGPVLFRTALASSLNIPAVELLSRLGIDEYGRFLAAAGFSLGPEDMEEAGLGLALGNAPVSLVELARAFAVFPRDGVSLSLRFDRAKDDDDEPGRRIEGGRIMSGDTARIICSILSDRRARRLAFGQGGGFETPFPAMFKTGTANQFQNIAALGATPRFTAAVWMGNFSGETVMGRTGSSLPASVVRSLLLHLEGASGQGASGSLQRPWRQFREPEGWIKAPVCALSGMTPSAACPSVMEEYHRPDRNAGICSWHKNGAAVVYPPEYQSWFLSSLREGELDYAAAPLEIASPQNNYVFFSSPGTGNHSIPVEVTGGSGDELIVNYSGETFTVRRPFVFFLPYRPGRHILTVSSGGESDTVEFTAR